MKVAIVGGGFGGLSIASKLAKHCQVIHVFDPLAPGYAGASSIAGGLMHPLAPRGNIVWKGLEGFDATSSSLKQLESLGYEGIVRPNFKLIRPVYKQDDLGNWIKAMNLTPALIGALDLCDIPPQVKQGNAALAYFHIKKATVINPVIYLQALWRHTSTICVGSEWIRRKADNIAEMTKTYDKVIIAGGHGSIPLFQQVSESKVDWTVQYVRGRIYQYCNGLDAKEALDIALLSGEYIVPSVDPDSGQPVLSSGASHDHIKAGDVFSDAEQYTYRNKALSENSAMDMKLQAKLTTIYPNLNTNHPLLSESSGIRLVTQRSSLGRLPIVGQHHDHKRVFVLSGLGARGLVYHALMADYLVEAILTDNVDCIPACLQPAAHSKLV